jgi:hypothetical protein
VHWLSAGDAAAAAAAAGLQPSDAEEGRTEWQLALDEAGAAAIADAFAAREVAHAAA